MNKREAKRLACFAAAQLIKTAWDNGWEPDQVYEEIETDCDLYLFRGAMGELEEELRRRGWMRS